MAFTWRVLTRVGKLPNLHVHENRCLRGARSTVGFTSRRRLNVGSLNLIRDVYRPRNGMNKYNRCLSSYRVQQIHASASRAAASHSVDKAEVSTDGRRLVVSWTDGNQSQYHSVWLRHNCHCASCKQKESGQKLVDVAAIPTDIPLHQVHLTGNNLCLTWGGKCEHTGELPASYLRRHDYSDTALNKQYQDSRLDENCWTKKISEMQYEEICSSDKALLSFLTTVNVSGLCLLKNIPEGEETVLKVARRIWPCIQNTIYGDIFEVCATPNPINVAYSTVHLDYHMDLVYYESPPGLQLLHAVRFDDCVVGGNSIFVDVFHVAHHFRTSHPTQFQSLVRIPASFQKVHYDRELPVHLIRQQPHIVLNHHGEIVRVNWAPAFEAPLSVNEDDVEEYYIAYEAFAKAIRDSPNSLKMRMKPGDMIVFNNRRMLHGREHFQLNEGVRFLKGAYVHIDHFKIRLQTLSNLVGDGSLVKRVGNGDWF